MSAGPKRSQVSTPTSSSAATRTSSSTVGSATSGSSTRAASACRTRISPGPIGRCSVRMSSCGGRPMRQATSGPPAGPRSGRTQAPRRRPSTSSRCHVTEPELVVVGRVGKSHGLDGSFVVEEASETHQLFAVGATLIVDGSEAKVTGSKHARGRPVIRLDQRAARGAELRVPRSALSPTTEGEYYVFQLVGLGVVEEGGGGLGTARDVAPGVANDIREIH